MDALDLRIRPPRSPRDRLDGLVFMPRTIDKIRATLPGGHLGPYHVFPGLSQMLLAAISVDLAALRDIVAGVRSDAEVAQWLKIHADTSQYPRANAMLSEWRHDTLRDDHRARFEASYPDYLRARYALGFDLIDADDRELYPVLRNR